MENLKKEIKEDLKMLEDSIQEYGVSIIDFWYNDFNIPEEIAPDDVNSNIKLHYEIGCYMSLYNILRKIEEKEVKKR